jgi:hypothetical protein
MKLIALAAFAGLAALAGGVTFAPSPANAFTINFDEAGNFSCNVSGCSMSTGPDPTHLVSGNVLIYHLPSTVVEGTGGIADPNGALSDALRWTDANGDLTGSFGTEMIFYSFDNNSLLADVGNVPAGFNPIIVATEGANGMFSYAPSINTGNVYNGLSGVSAVPGPIAGAGLPGLLFAGGGLLGWWRRRQKIV